MYTYSTMFVEKYLSVKILLNEVKKPSLKYISSLSHPKLVKYKRIHYGKV